MEWNAMEFQKKLLHGAETGFDFFSCLIHPHSVFGFSFDS